MKISYVFLILFLFCGGCTFSPADKAFSVVEVDFPADSISMQLFFDKIADITLVPLETTPEILLSGTNELTVQNQEYFITDLGRDKKVFRFAPDGKFLNAIGRKGRGAGEYIDIRNIQVLGDTVIVYSRPNTTLHYYTKEGQFVRKEEFPDSYQQGYKFGRNAYVWYNGYGMPAPERMVSQIDSEKNNYLSLGAKVLAFDEATPVFYPDGKNIYIREAYCDTVYCYDTKTGVLKPYLQFDMQENAIKKAFFQCADAFESAAVMMDSNYAIIRRYSECSQIKIIEILLVNPQPHLVYGVCIKPDSTWTWSSLGEAGTAPFSGAIKQVDEQFIYCLVEPEKLRNLSEVEKSKISNLRVLDQVGEEDNVVVAKLRYK